jgi:pyruvate dehydrogenase E2 component (dihydrolipoamide acetyltransferase)
VLFRSLVAPGDVVEVGQTLMVVETDKVTAEVPAPMPGRITEVLVDVETEVEVGTPIVILASE